MYAHKSIFASRIPHWIPCTTGSWTKGSTTTSCWVAFHPTTTYRVSSLTARSTVIFRFPPPQPNPPTAPGLGPPWMPVYISPLELPYGIELYFHMVLHCGHFAEVILWFLIQNWLLMIVSNIIANSGTSICTARHMFTNIYTRACCATITVLTVYPVNSSVTSSSSPAGM